MKKQLNQPIVISLTVGTLFKTFFVLIMFYLMYVLRDLLLVLLTSVILASAVEPLAKFFTKRRIPRVISVIMVYVGIIALLVGIFSAFFPALIEETQNILNTLPTYLTEISESEQFAGVPELSQIVEALRESLQQGQIITTLNNTSGATAGFVTALSAFFGGVFSAMLILVFSFYLSVQENGVDNLIRIVVPIRHEKYIIDLWHRSQRKIGLWMQGQLLLSVIISVLTYLGLSILGVGNALVLALVAGVFELIPVFGPILAAIPAIGFSLVQGGVTLALVVAGLYVIIQQFESQLIHPLVVKKIVGIPALIAILALIVGAQIAGFLGVLISVPVTAAIMEYITDVEKKKAKELKALGELK
jgi:predicted PurR-regulated permease PerM